MSEERKEATFHARKSGRVAASITTDHDTWVERLAVVDMLVPNTYTQNGQAKYELQIRSFFESEMSGKKCWDEPPSGAERIQYASDEMRRMADLQKRDLECVHIPNSNIDNTSTSSSSNVKFGQKVKNLFQRRRNRNKNTNTNTTSTPIDRKITIKEDSPMAEFLNTSRDMNMNNNEYYNPNQRNLEYAIAQSLNDSSPNSLNHDNFGQYDSRTDFEKAMELSITETRRTTPSSSSQLISNNNNEDEDIALATALSLSLNDTCQSKIMSKTEIVSTCSDDDDENSNEKIENCDLNIQTLYKSEENNNDGEVLVEVDSSSNSPPQDGKDIVTSNIDSSPKEMDDIKLQVKSEII